MDILTRQLAAADAAVDVRAEMGWDREDREVCCPCPAAQRLCVVGGGRSRCISAELDTPPALRPEPERGRVRAPFSLQPRRILLFMSPAV